MIRPSRAERGAVPGASMSKRRQRSTAIRKRIEKRAREENRAKKKAEKAAGGRSDSLLAARLPRATVEACAAALADLEARLAKEPVRGWTRADLEGDFGLQWLGALLGEALAASDGDPLNVEFLEEGRGPVLERLGVLELAAPGLRVSWDEAGFQEVMRGISTAQDVEVEAEEGEEGGEEAASSDETAEAGDDEDETTKALREQA